HSNESRRTSERPPPRHPHRYRIHAHHLHRSNHQLRTEMDLLNEHHAYTFAETCRRSALTSWTNAPNASQNATNYTRNYKYSYASNPKHSQSEAQHSKHTP